MGICLCNLIEHYDTALYGFLAPFLAPYFFPAEDPLTGLIGAYAVIPVGMLSRPFGAWFFGWLSERKGLLFSLRVSLIGVGLGSLLMAFIPTYASVGILAPFLLCLTRMFQNFMAAGELMGGGQLLMQAVPEAKRDLASGLFNATTILGLMLASFVVYQLSHSWRLMYLMGAFMSFFVLWLRGDRKPITISKKPFIQELREHRRGVFSVVIGSGFGYASYVIALVLMNGFIPLITDISKEEMVKINTYLLLLDGLLLPLFGWLAAKVNRNSQMVVAAVLVLLLAGPLLMCLKGASLLLVIGVRAIFVSFGVLYFAPFHAWASDRLPSRSLASFSYAIGTQIFGGPCAFISLFCYQVTGVLVSVMWYWMALAFLTLIALLPTRSLRCDA